MAWWLQAFSKNNKRTVTNTTKLEFKLLAQTCQQLENLQMGVEKNEATPQ